MIRVLVEAVDVVAVWACLGYWKALRAHEVVS